MAIVASTCLLFGATIAERRIANQEARRAQQAAETANRAKSQFLAVMSHELRTPLNAIQGFAQLLETGVYGQLNEKQIDAVQRIVQNEKSLLALINEMLGFVDAERGPLAGESEDVLVADAFDSVEQLIRREVARKHLVVQREIAQPQLAVRADPKALQQILTSLLSNATKYTGDGGTITLGADGVADKVRLWVRDSGIGITHEQIERVFEPFFQAQSGTTRQYSGVGLGLTIARNLAQRMSGEVTIASELGKGTTAAVVLPAAQIGSGERDEESAARGVAA
jgi:signal transduction histidine kinase